MIQNAMLLEYYDSECNAVSAMIQSAMPSGFYDSECNAIRVL